MHAHLEITARNFRWIGPASNDRPDYHGIADGVRRRRDRHSIANMEMRLIRENFVDRDRAQPALLGRERWDDSGILCESGEEKERQQHARKLAALHSSVCNRRHHHLRRERGSDR